MFVSHAKAVEAYRYYGLRLRVALGAQARSSKARALRAASSAGLADVQAARDYVPLRWVDDQQQFAMLLAARRAAYNAQLQRELGE